MTDWGWGSYTLKACVNGKYLSSNWNGLEANVEEIRGWYIQESFNFHYNDEGFISLHNWKGERIFVTDENLELIENGEDEDLFEVVFISRGLENANMIARQSDAAIVFVGNHPLINGKEDQDRPD